MVNNSTSIITTNSHLKSLNIKKTMTYPDPCFTKLVLSYKKDKMTNNGQVNTCNTEIYR